MPKAPKVLLRIVRGDLRRAKLKIAKILPTGHRGLKRPEEWRGAPAAKNVANFRSLQMSRGESVEAKGEEAKAWRAASFRNDPRILGDPYARGEGRPGVLT